VDVGIVLHDSPDHDAHHREGMIGRRFLVGAGGVLTTTRPLLDQFTGGTGVMLGASRILSPM
jgi:hypothetical protein